MDADAGDVAGVAEAEVGPCLAAVDGAVDAVAVADVAADLGLAHAGVDHVGVGLGGGDGPDCGGVEEAVRDVFPVGAAVRGLPDATGAGAEVEDAGVGNVASYGDGAAAAMGTDETPFHSVEQVRMHGCKLAI